MNDSSRFTALGTAIVNAIENSAKRLSSDKSDGKPAKVFEIALKMAVIERQWPQLAGPQLARRTWPVGMNVSCLLVICDSPSAAQMVIMSTGSILKRLEQRCAVVLPTINVQVGPMPRQRKALPPPQAKTLKVPKEALDAALERIGDAIENKEVALALARMEAAAKTRWGDGKKARGGL